MLAAPQECFPLHHFLTGNIILALPVDWPHTSSNCHTIADVLDRSFMPCGNGSLLHPDARTDHVRTIVFQSQVWWDLVNCCVNEWKAPVYAPPPPHTPPMCVCSVFRAETAVLTDDRIRRMNEVISGIRVIKMFGWEKSFASLVDEVRRSVNVS